MNKFFNILQKELKDLLTLRMVLPFILSIFILFFIGQIMQQEMGRAVKPLNVGIMNLDKTPSSSNTFIEELKKSSYFIIEPIGAINDTQAIRIGQENNFHIVVIIPEDFGNNLQNKEVAEIKIYSIINSLSIVSSVQISGIKNLLRLLNQKIAESYLKELKPDLKPEIIWEPIRPREFVVIRDLIQPGSAAFVIGYISSQTVIVPVALLMLIIITGTMIAASIAQEKENKTLETILTIPVSRFVIVLAKMLAAVILALGFAFFFIVAMGSFMGSFGNVSAQAPTNLSDLGPRLNLNLTFNARILLGISIFLSLVSALALATLLALFAQDVKDAQTTIMPLTIMIMIPYFFSLTFDPNTMGWGMKIFTFLIPFSHTFFAFKFLLFGQYLPVILGIIYLVIFSIILLFLTTKVFSSERILTMKFNFAKFLRRP